MTTAIKETTKLNREMEQDKRYLSFQRDRESFEIGKLESEPGEERYRVDNLITNGVYFVGQEGKRLVCSCPDFQNRCSELNIRCKHILSVENWKGKKDLIKKVVEIEEILKRKFREDQIKQRPGSYKKLLDYLETHSVIERLNEAFGLKWSWEVVKSEILEGQVYCHGKLSAKIDGEMIVKEAFGGKEISKGNNMGDELKAAASDALKKAATMLGVGLHLYEKARKDNGKIQVQLKPLNNTNKVNGNGGRNEKVQVQPLKPLDNTNKVNGNGGGNEKVQVQPLKPLDNTNKVNGNGGNGSNGGPKASMRQVRYIKDLYKDLRIELKINVAALSRDQASELIEKLQRELINRKNQK